MRKLPLVAAAASGLVLFGVFFAPNIALADDDDEDDSSVVEPYRPGHSETDRKHKDLEDRYGKEGHLIVPPLVIRPEKDGEEDLVVSPPTSTGTATQNSVLPNSQPITTQKSSAGSFVLTTPHGQPVGSIAGTPPVLANETLTSFNPEQNMPVEIDSRNLTNKTPADLFIESATAGLIAMGVGAISLGAIAGTRAIRRK